MKYRINIKMIEYHLNIIIAMNERLTHAILESNVNKRQNGEISLEHIVGKLQNMNKEFYKRMIKDIEDVNAKLNTKIRKENDEVIFYFNYTILETMNKISK